MKKSIYQIHTELLEGTSFRTKTELDMFNECVDLFQEKRFYASCSLGMVLFEKIFFSRLHTLTYLPDDFTPTISNVKDHIKFYLDRERVIIDGSNSNKKRGLTFYDVTYELFRSSVISKEQKDSYDEFYKQYRVPVQHGLTLRLYEKVTDRKVIHLNEVDMMSEQLHEKVAELVIRKIYEASKLEGIWG